MNNSKYILGISCYFHDAAAALIQGGKVVAASHEERFTRKKQDSDFPEHAIEFCLKEAGITMADVEAVVFYEKPFLKFERLLTQILQGFPQTYWLLFEMMTQWVGKKLWVRHVVSKALHISPQKVLFTEHHMSHAASAYFVSPFEKATIVTIDGVGEKATTTVSVGEGNSIRMLKEIHFPHSIGLLYSAFTAWLGFEVNEGEYKVMGMAPYGRPLYVDKVRKMVKMHEDGSYELNLKYFLFHTSSDTSFSHKFVQLFGKPRKANTHFFTESSGYPHFFGKPPENYEELAKENQYYADVAASLQKVTEELVLHVVESAVKMTGISQVCLAGGVALNSVANSVVARSGLIEKLFVQPAAGDAGGALGAALYASSQIDPTFTRVVQRNVSWGRVFFLDAIEQVLAKQDVSYVKMTESDLLEQVAQDLMDNKVVGWYQGRAEWGPRALGHRSIIANPTTAAIRDQVNEKIKFRELFRPFAPAVLSDKAAEYFDLDPKAEYLYPFMLAVVPVKEDKKAVIPAVTHIDGTARIQTVNEYTERMYRLLIEAFAKKSGVPVILNTSFNVKGEPIVDSPEDALDTFWKSGLDILVLGQYYITKNDL